MPAVSFQNVSKTYASARGELQALKGVSFDIQPGEFFGLLGPNGAGKTTLISVLAGLVQRPAKVNRVPDNSAAVTPAQIAAAARRIRGAVPQTPLVPAERLSRMLGAEIRLKLENLQLAGSFKARGALNRLLTLTARERTRGVIAMSAGNHAQGVAYHCQRLGIPATIVMPRGTPFTKVERTAGYGAQVILEGEGLDGASEHAHALAAQAQLTFIHPYDDPQIIAGQGTVGREIIRQWPEVEVIAAPIGGGGLMAGIAIATSERSPAVSLIGVQAALYPQMVAAIRGEAAPQQSGTTLAEGIAVKRPGRLTLPVIRARVAALVTVSEVEIERAILTLMVEEKIWAEGAAAAPLAALMRTPLDSAGRRIAIVVSGGNIDQRLVASILMRGLIADGRIARLRVEITDQPGWLARVASVIGESGGNIIEVDHQRLFLDVPVTRTDIDIVIEARGKVHVDAIVGRLGAAGFAVQRLGILAVDAAPAA